jgi:hypothetical protein
MEPKCLSETSVDFIELHGDISQETQLFRWQDAGIRRSWKETAVDYSQYYSCIFLEVPRKTMKTSMMAIGVPAEIRTDHVHNTRLECYR